MTDNRFRVINLFQVSDFPDFRLNPSLFLYQLTNLLLHYKLTTLGGEYRAATDDPPDTNRDAPSLPELIPAYFSSDFRAKISDFYCLGSWFLTLTSFLVVPGRVELPTSTLSV